MPVASATETETWQVWYPPHWQEVYDLLTRDEMLARANASGYPATIPNLKFWLRTGLLPKPVRRWHAGRIRPTFPCWYPELIGRLRLLQSQGLTTKELKPRLRAFAGELIYARFSYDGMPPHILSEGLIPTELIDAIRAHGIDLDAVTGTPQQSADLIYRDVTGGEHHYKIALPF